MNTYLHYALDLIGADRRRAATHWSLAFGKFVTTVALWGFFTGLTLFGLLWLTVGIVLMVSR